MEDIALQVPISVYLLLTGWTMPRFRRMGMSAFLRALLLKEKSTTNSFILGVSTNQYAFPLLQKLGCVKINPMEIPYVQVLSCIHRKMGQSINDSTKTAQSFWVSNPMAAYDLNQQLQEVIPLSAKEWKRQLAHKILFRLNF